MVNPVKVSVVIKALNEAGNIRRAIESSLGAVAPFDGEVILADSGSTDGTIETASELPITIVQLARPDERCCGVGPQLGYQHSRGEYIYILDGDMTLNPDFLTYAVEFLDRERSCAGVGGFVREMRIENLEFEARVRRFNERLIKGQTADVLSLSGGGLYRRAAVEQVGYISDRNLHGYEEYDLGVRLRAKGWRLVRSEMHSADHYSYAMGTWSLLRHRIRAGYMLSAGELLRAAIANHYTRRAFSELRALRIALGVWVYWGVALLIAGLTRNTNWALVVLLLAVALPVAGMAIRTKSLLLGSYSVFLWHANAVGLLFGLMRRRIPPTNPIESRIVRHPPLKPVPASKTAECGTGEPFGQRPNI